MSRDDLYLEYMRDAIRKIGQFTTNIDADGFLKDEKTQSAVMLQLMLIGEMAKKLSDESKTAFKLPWKEISGFRDRAIHDYYDMDLDIIWDTIQKDIPVLKSALGTNRC